jgi:signal transduction histidine kinase
MRRIPIRVKLAAALAIPLIAMGAVTVLEVVSVADEAREVREQTDLATATIGPNGLITALQNERNWPAAQLVGVDQTLELEVTGYDRTRAETDAALADFERELDRRPDTARAAYAPALENLGDLAALRQEIDGIVASTTPSFDNIGFVTPLFDRYTALIEPFFGGMSRISIAMDDPQLRQGADLMEAVTRQIETTTQLANALALPATVSTAPGDLPGINRSAEIAEVAELQDAFHRQADTLRTASGRYGDIAAEFYPEEFTGVLNDQSDKAIATGQLDIDVFLSELDVGTLDLAYLGYRDGIAAALQDRADELNASTTTRQRTFRVLMIATFAGAVALTVIVSRSITRPLRSLTRQAKEMADRRLPSAVTEILETPLGDDVTMPTVTPVQVATRDEVADVAEALNTVQDSALDLAVEQAVLRRNIADSFVNLGRRNQNLLGRQLDFITELESAETDPDTLGSLFRLDHLATRMRRNAESLLVLAGIEPPRQWAAPVQLTDVIRAALGEVENYQRVTIRGLEPATVLGSAAADLAHLLAELIENALVFSPPDRTVEIRGLRRSPGHDEVPRGAYTLAVIDSGLGMSDQDIAAANRRLAGVESFTVAPSKYLGHYVAGNLAARHDIEVRLHNTPGSGITATVELPAGLLTPDGNGHAGAVGLPRAHRPLPAAPPPLPAAPAPIAAPPTAWAAPGGPSALVRRTPPAATGGPGRAPAEPTESQLASLARVAGRGRTGQTPNGAAGSAGQIPPAPDLRSPLPPRLGAGDPPPLARRDRGAQMPTTAPLNIPRTPSAETAPARPPAPPSPPSQTSQTGPVLPPGVAPTAGTERAAEVYGFLSSFTAGVQRGLDAARSTRGNGPAG